MRSSWDGAWPCLVLGDNWAHKTRLFSEPWATDVIECWFGWGFLSPIQEPKGDDANQRALDYPLNF